MYDKELKPVMTAKEVSAFLGIGISRVYQLVRAKKLRALPVGRKVRIPRHAVLEFIGALDKAG